jgi:hypothetical protein
MTPPLLGTASKLLPHMVDERSHCTRGSYDVKSPERLPRLTTRTSPQTHRPACSPPRRCPHREGTAGLADGGKMDAAAHLFERTRMALRELAT